jgi:hypothetical protein
MMKKFMIIPLLTAGMFVAVSCNSGSTNAKNNSEIQNVSAEVYYTCSMHPEVHSDKPGDCPKCGMELVKKEAAKSDSTHMQHDADSAEHHH